MSRTCCPLAGTKASCRKQIEAELRSFMAFANDMEPAFLTMVEAALKPVLAHQAGCSRGGSRGHGGRRRSAAPMETDLAPPVGGTNGSSGHGLSVPVFARKLPPLPPATTTSWRHKAVARLGGDWKWMRFTSVTNAANYCSTLSSNGSRVCNPANGSRSANRYEFAYELGFGE